MRPAWQLLPAAIAAACAGVDRWAVMVTWLLRETMDNSSERRFYAWYWSNGDCRVCHAN